MKLFLTGIQVPDQVVLSSYGDGTYTGTAAYSLTVDNAGNVIESSLPSVDGTGTANFIPKWVDTDTLTSSIMREEVITGVPYIGVGTAAEEFIQFKVNNYIASKGEYGPDNFVYLKPIGEVEIQQVRPTVKLVTYLAGINDAWIIDVRSDEAGLVIRPDGTLGSTNASFTVRNKTDVTKFKVDLPNNLVASYSTFVLDGGTTPLELRFLEDFTNGVHYTGFKAPASLAADLMYTMPSVAPANGQVLAWNTGGGLSWETVSAGSGDVSKVGTPVDNQVAVWTGDGTIEGTTGFTYNGSNLQLTGDIGSTGTRITKGWFTDLQVTNAIAGSVTGNAATVTTNANLTGHVTSTGNAAVLGSFTVAQLNTAISDGTIATGGGTATGTNTGDQTITLTGDVTGTGTGSFATTIAVGAGGIYEGSGTIASATVSTLTSTSTFEIDYAGGNDAIKIDDTAGTTTFSSKTTGALTIASDIVSLQGKSATSVVSELRFYEASVNGSNYVGLKAPAVLAGDPVFTLPTQLPSTTQFMTSTVTGVLSFSQVRNFRNFFALNSDGHVNVTADQNEDGITFYSDDNSIRMVGDNAYGGLSDDAITFRLAIDKLTNSLTDLTLASADTFVVWDATASANKSLTVQSLTDYIDTAIGGGGGGGRRVFCLFWWQAACG